MMNAEISKSVVDLAGGRMVLDLEENVVLGKVDENKLAKFHNQTNGCIDSVITDCPDFFEECFWINARRYDPEIYKTLSYQIKAGLRPLEVCGA